MINKQNVNRHFSKAAAEYDRYACVQKKMAQRLIQKIQLERPPQHILEIGCGTGCLTRELAERFPDAEITATDLSENMLLTAAQNLAQYPQIHYATADGERLAGPARYDLVISNAVFQWFLDCPQALRGIQQVLRPKGHLCYATFGPHTFCELKQAFQTAYAANEQTDNWHSGPEFYPAKRWLQWLENAGFSASLEEEYYQEYFPTVRKFLHSVKKTGANNASSAVSTKISRKIMLDMLEAYHDLFQENGQVQATYHALYGIAAK